MSALGHFSKGLWRYTNLVVELLKVLSDKCELGSVWQ
jgi:hypothetical protein